MPRRIMVSSSSSASASSSSRLRMKQWFLLATAFCFLPLLATYWHLFQWLASKRCVLYQPIMTPVTNNSIGLSTTTMEMITTTSHESSIGGLVCQGRRSSLSYVLDTESLSQSPPSIARLVAAIAGTGAGVVDSNGRGMGVLRQRRETQAMQYPPDAHRFDYSNESPLSMAAVFGHSIGTHGQEAIQSTETNTDTGYGFRKNPNHRSVSRSVPVPVATYFWLALNVGLYGWYWHHGVDPSTVALDGGLLGLGIDGNGNSNGKSDFGKALSGNLAHFEVWHLGLNAMSLMSLGESLETTATFISGSSIGMLLWTASFLAINTLVVVGGYAILAKLQTRRQQQQQQQQHHPPRFPSMVGFSGILFCWSVATALSLPESAAICPIPVLTSVCFQTHRFRGGWSFSWAPLVQLAMVQLVLPRASFAGHLSGLLVGFLWHWRLLPSLDWSQPCVLYPVLWAVGKYGLHRYRYRYCWGADPEQGTNSNWGSEGYRHRDGHVLGSIHNHDHRWGGSSSEPRDERETPWLRALRSAFGIHWVGMALAFRVRGGAGILGCDSIVVSELLLVLLFSLLVRARAGSGDGHDYDHGNDHDHDNPFASVGILGRAYVAFALVALATDSMTLGGWWATGTGPRFWSVGSLLVVLRVALWVLSVGAACHVLLDRRSASSTGNNSGGIWTHVLGRSVLDPCASLGSACVAAWNTTPSQRHTTTGSKLQGGGIALGTTSGNSSGSSSNGPLDRRELSARRAKLFSNNRTVGTASARGTSSSPKTTTTIASSSGNNNEDASMLV
eukprot:jgi/Psemu1/45246/gm1.45246_g